MSSADQLQKRMSACIDDVANWMSSKAAITIAIRLKFDFDSTRRSGHHDSMLMKA